MGDWIIRLRYSRQSSVVVEPLLHHLSDKQGSLVQSLLRHQQPTLSHAHVQPLTQQSFLHSHLKASLEISKNGVFEADIISQKYFKFCSQLVLILDES